MRWRNPARKADMPAPHERSALTSKLNKAQGLLQNWCNAAAAHPALFARCKTELAGALSHAGFSAMEKDLEITPFILDANSVRALTRDVRSLCAIFEKINKLALINVAFLRRLELSPSVESLLRREPEARLTFEFARLDFVPLPSGPRFVGFEFDAPRGAGLAAELQRAFLGHELCALAGIARLQPSALSTALLADMFMAVWRERGAATIARPNFAIFDWRESNCTAEQKLALDELRSRGLVALRADPRELKYHRDAGELRLGSTRIDLACRAIPVSEISVRRPLLAALLEAVADNAVTVVNCLRARPAQGAAALEVLTSREFNGFFTAAENEIKARLLPWTRRLAEGRTDYLGRDVELSSILANKQERFIIKTAAESGGEVAVGALIERQEWLARIDAGLKRGDIAQEFVPPLNHSCAAAVGGEGRNLLLGAYAVRGEYAGCTAWCSAGAVVAPDASQVTPVLEVGGRSKTGPIEAGRPTRKRKPTHTQQN